MTQEEKSLLLQDLCSRLPYGVICSIYRIDDWNVGWRDEKLTGYFYDGNSFEFYFGKTPISIDNDISKIKPYLRPLSSMTEEEKEELKEISNDYLDEWENAKTPIERLKLDAKVSYKRAVFYNSHHLDWNDLTSKGLAIEVTEENNPYKE